MKVARWLVLVTAAAVLATLGSAAQGAARSVEVRAVIWQLQRDYPGAADDDKQMPFRAVQVKTHDGTDWMSTYDEHPLAVSGPESLRTLIDIYGAQGISVSAWFVPAGRDVARQLDMATQVIDSGVSALYADIEPFAGFCNADCEYLADEFWTKLRQERPNARLGVIYDPRVQTWGPSATSKWLAVADEAQPMCYWETFAGEPPWDDPAKCVSQAYADLWLLVPGKTLDYAPMLQGDSTPWRFREALDAAAAVGSERVSVWRRGVVPAETWDMVRTYEAPETDLCWVKGVDGCAIREDGSEQAYLVLAGTKWAVDAMALAGVGLGPDSVEVVPQRIVPNLPSIPKDHTLLAEGQSDEVWVVMAGARFRADAETVYEPFGLDPSGVVRIPIGTLKQVPLSPPDYSRVKERNGSAEYVVIAERKVLLNEERLQALLAAGYGAQVKVVPDGGLTQITDAVLSRGDVNCDGTVDAVDAQAVLRLAASLPNLGVCVDLGDADCDSTVDAVDALAILRYVAGLDGLRQDGARASWMHLHQRLG